MSQVRSFAQYVDKNFYDDIYDAVQSYARNHADRLDLRFYKVKTIESLELSGISFKSVKIFDLPGMEIAFDIIVDAELYATEANHHYDEGETRNQWFMVKCRGDLSKNLEDFKIIGTEVYTKGLPKANPLSDALVPIIRKDELEKTAENFIKKYYHEAYFTTKPIDPIKLAKRMNLNVKVRSITKDCSIFGQVYFHSKEAELYNDETDELEKVHVEPGTILVDKNAYFLRNLGMVNNTIVHECVHWDKHRKAFELERLYNEEACRVECEVTGGIRNKSGEAISYIETQANILAPRIQMPMYGFKRKAAEYINSYRMETRTSNLIDIIQPVIEALAIYYGVSKLAAKIRMLEAGYEEAAGAFIYVDDHYVRTHTFKKGALTTGQTFTISSQDAAAESFFNKELRSFVENGTYLFVENHFVLNSPEYLKRDLFGNLCLTDYALTHMDECCLVFDMMVKGKIAKDYQKVCFLNREAKSDVTFEVKYHNGYENTTDEKKIALLKRQQEKFLEIRNQMTDNPEDCLKLLVKWRKTTYAELGATIGVDSKTLTRYGKERTRPPVETGVLICFALQLPPVISEKLLQVLGCYLSPTNLQHQWIAMALRLKYSEPLENVRKFLSNFNVEI
ncbi:MAG: hypothetical protein LKE29_05400 [Acidaminococcaceae bacterium]|nr:hypothetical protein [Acidaminococcaceae bacterium]